MKNVLTTTTSRRGAGVRVGRKRFFFLPTTMMMMLRSLTVVLFVVLNQAEARRRRRRRTDNVLADEAYTVLKWVFFIAFGVPIALFCYRVFHDPLTPHIFKELYYRVKDRFVMTVGGPKAKRLAKRAARRRRREFLRARRGAVEFEYGYEEDDPHEMFRRRIQQQEGRG